MQGYINSSINQHTILKRNKVFNGKKTTVWIQNTTSSRGKQMLLLWTAKCNFLQRSKETKQIISHLRYTNWKNILIIQANPKQWQCTKVVRTLLLGNLNKSTEVLAQSRSTWLFPKITHCAQVTGKVEATQQFELKLYAWILKKLKASSLEIES